MKMEYQIQDFIEECVAKGLSKKTYASYEQTLILFARYLQDVQHINDVTQITTDVIRDYVKYIRDRGKYTVVSDEDSINSNHPNNRKDYGKRVSDVTINNYIRNIKVFFAYLKDHRIIKSNPAKQIKSIKVVRKPLNFLTDAEFNRLLKSMDLSKKHEYRDYIIMKTLLDTGMRVGECLLIQVEDIDFNDRTILLPAENTKGKKSRYVFFSQELAKELRKWLQYKDRYLESEYLFPTIRSTPLQIGNYETNLKKYGIRAEIADVHPHMFRNNFAKRFLMSGGDIYTLSRILGHSSVEVTEKEYLDLDVTDLKKQYSKHSPLMNMRK